MREGQGRQGWSLEDKLGLGCARLGWAGLDWTRGAAVLAGEFVDRRREAVKKYDSFFSTCLGWAAKDVLSGLLTKEVEKVAGCK